MDVSTKIKTLCIEILALLKEAREKNWSTAFESFIAELDAQHVYKKIFAVYGGAGSFNDLVMYSEGTLWLGGNNKLDAARKKLYEALVQELYLN